MPTSPRVRAFLDAPMPGATDIVVQRRLLRRSVLRGLVDDVVPDLLWGDPGDGPTNDLTPYIGGLQWRDPHGRVAQTDLDPGQWNGDDDWTAILHYGHHWRIAVHREVETGGTRLLSGTRIEDTWFRAGPAPEPIPKVQCTVDGPRIRIVSQHTSMVPAVDRRMLTRLRSGQLRASQEWVLDLDDRRLALELRRDGELDPDVSFEVDRSRVLVLFAGRVWTTDGPIAYPDPVGIGIHQDTVRRVRTGVQHHVNRALGVQ